MLSACLYRLIVAVTILALMGGMTVQAMPPSALAVTGAPLNIGDECAQMAMMQPMQHHAMPAMPHKGNDLDCVKQMGCLGTASLPARLSIGSVPLSYGAVAYWVPEAVAAGRTIEPDLLPPIGS